LQSVYTKAEVQVALIKCCFRPRLFKNRLIIQTNLGTAWDKLERELLGRARTVAGSVDGFLGIGTISPETEDKLEELARAFS